MKFTIITPNLNGEQFLEQTLQSVLTQRREIPDLEYIVVDGHSSDRSMEIIDRYRDRIDQVICEPDQGAASAINKGLARASGEIIGWLNADDCYHPGALQSVQEALEANASRALAFGKCRIINERNEEIRRPISRFKEAFFPLSCRFMIQSINYISQPAMFFRRSAMQAVGPLREDLKAAWDYDYTLRLWQQGGAVCLGNKGLPLADFRWHENSISGSSFRHQFKEEYDLAVDDAGRFSPQALLHAGARLGIISIYRLLQIKRGKRAVGS